MNLGPPEIVLILVVVLLLFGAKKLPELARSMGRASKEFKSGMQEGGRDETEPAEQTPQASSPQPTQPSPTDAKQDGSASSA